MRYGGRGVQETDPRLARNPRGGPSCRRCGVFYRPAVDDVLKRGELVEIQALIKGAREVKAKYGDIDGLISKLEAAARKAR